MRICAVGLEVGGQPQVVGGWRCRGQLGVAIVKIRRRRRVRVLRSSDERSCLDKVGLNTAFCVFLVGVSSDGRHGGQNARVGERMMGASKTNMDVLVKARRCGARIYPPKRDPSQCDGVMSGRSNLSVAIARRTEHAALAPTTYHGPTYK